MLGRELSGSYSRRQFKVRYQTDLARRHSDETFTAAVFSLEDLEAVIAAVGHNRAQEMIRALGARLNSHFGKEGGFAARRRIGEIAAVLPFSDVKEAERILSDFKEQLRRHGPDWLGCRGGEKGAQAGSVEFVILAGVAPGKHQIELESVMEFARFNQKEIASFRC